VQGFRPDHDRLWRGALRGARRWRTSGGFRRRARADREVKGPHSVRRGRGRWGRRAGWPDPDRRGEGGRDRGGPEGPETPCRDRRRVLQIPWQADLVPPPDVFPLRSPTGSPCPPRPRKATSPRPAAFPPMGRIEGRRSSWRSGPPLKGRDRGPRGGLGLSGGEILAEQEAIAHLDLIEADHDMLEAARANVDDPRAAFHWADVTRFDPGEPMTRSSPTRPSTPDAAPTPALGGPSSRRRPAC
jgi:hypothetical protein